MSRKDMFSSRWGLVLAALGMAIGAGNLWRFPKLAAQYGGTFLILWIIFLLIWSIPILLVEFSLGKKYKMGVIGSYAAGTGRKWAWGGFFITICTLGIAFYYSVITGWALRYLMLSFGEAFKSISGGATIYSNKADVELYWQKISNGDWLTVFSYAFVVSVAVLLLVKGIQNGLEKVNKILIPTLFILLAIIAAVSLSMENGLKGLEYMFTVDPELFYDSTVWIEALTDSAWSTGAGWGLMLTISSYSRIREDVSLNTFIGGFGNNTAALLAATAIIPSVFALSTSDQAAVEYLKTGSQALTFTVIPQLFATIPGGAWLSIVFFLAFLMAAFTSFLPMLELFIRNLTDYGLKRKNAAYIAGIGVVILGFPSAWSLDIFNNQDWVWGIGLIITGILIAFAAVRHGVDKYREEYIDVDSDFKVSPIYLKFSLYLVIPMGMFLIYWWMSQGNSENPWFDEQGNWNIFDVYSNASVISQWAIVFIAGFILNRWLYKRFVK